MRTLLVHGLGRTPLSLALLGRSLRQAGHTTTYFGYAAFAEPYERIRRRLTARLMQLADDPAPIALIGHSLGGLLLRHALADASRLRVHRLIMLGTPNQPPRRARFAQRWLPFRVFARTSGALLASPQAYSAIPAPRVPYTIIAGTGGPRWLAAPFGRDPHDGFVSVSETCVSPDDRPVLLPVMHTLMMNDRRLQEVVLRVLQEGKGGQGATRESEAEP